VKGSAYGFVVTGTGPAGNYQAYTSTGDGSTWLPTGSLGTTAASKLSQQTVLLQASTSGLVGPVTLASLPGAVVPEIAVKSLTAADSQQIAVGSAHIHQFQPSLAVNSKRRSLRIIQRPRRAWCEG
jgi:hypothetical protein